MHCKFIQTVRVVELGMLLYCSSKFTKVLIRLWFVGGNCKGCQFLLM